MERFPRVHTSEDLVKMAVFTKLICRLSAILSKSQQKQKIKLNSKCSGNIKGQNNQDSFQKRRNKKSYKLIL